MLPARIKALVIQLYERTEAGEIKWRYDDDASRVTTYQDTYTLSITYRFDDIEEVGRFNIKFDNKENYKEYFFSTSQQYSDYELVRSLFDSAQSSDLDLDI
ncbi:hypothetical protein [Burkholderia cepacia]|uniref:hypothetical protein n=1 Tax=Burkholderia cepacia TaxID=292 RepID=UPI000A8E6B67|nr:hypothetical protein [Burkholderia cepacia]